MSSKFKNTLVSMLFSVLAFGVTAQKRAMSFNDYGPERVLLDSLYQNAMNADSTRAVFGDRQEAFMVAWPEFLAELAHYLKDHDFQWGAPTRCFARIYFADTGRVDLFLYSFREGTIDRAKEERFGELLNGFLAAHEFPLKAAVPFAQCGPVVFQDAPLK